MSRIVKSPPAEPAPPVAAQGDAGRYLLRPAALADLPALELLAEASAIGISSLVPDRALLRDKLERSLKSFAADDDVSGEEHYLFVLEDRTQGGALVGTSGIAASAGFHDRFYSYRNEYVVQVSPELEARNRIHTLHLCHDLTGVTLLTGFHIDPAHAAGVAPQLLSRGRLLFIAQFPERFADRIASEHPGLADDSGRCPFWDAVGRRFFNMDYPAAEQLASGPQRTLIAELLPQSPIYVPLLPEEAQWSLGQLHPVAELPFQILLDEGLDADSYLNLFDGGPTMEGRLPLLRSVAARRVFADAHDAGQGLRQGRWLLANAKVQDFRASVCSGPLRPEDLSWLAGDGGPLAAAPLPVGLGGATA